MRYFILILITLNLFGSDFTQMKEAFESGDTNRAISYARYNATNSNVDAMYNLGLLYYAKGSINKAQTWFENSVENGGKGKLGIALILFSKGKTQAQYEDILKILDGIEQNDIGDALVNVLNDLKDKQDNASANDYLLLAELFSSDKIVRRNNNLAFMLVKKAAQKENPKALEMIADAYNTMKKSPITAPRSQNTLIKAISYYQQSYRLNNYDAMAKLGTLHIVGPRHVKRIKKGKELVKTAKANGSLVAKKIIENGYRYSSFNNSNSEKSYHILFREF